MTTDHETTLAWQATPRQAPVLDAHGRRMGTVESLLAEPEEDIFHGLAMKETHGRRTVEIPAAHVKRITARAIETDLELPDLVDLATYRESHRYHIGWGGIFRHRPEWREDS